MTQEDKKVLCEKMAEYLPVLRTVLRISQADLAELIGVSRQTVVAFEKRKRDISWSVFLSLYLLFHRNNNTEPLLRLYCIQTPELEKYLTVM